MIYSDQNIECSLTPAGLKLADNYQILMNPVFLRTQDTKNILNNISGEDSQIIKITNNDFYISLGEYEFLKTVNTLSQKGFVLISLFCVQDFEGNPDFTLFYVFRLKGFTDLFIFMRHVLAETTSIAAIFPSACWYEREIRDGFGVEFTDAFDKRKLLLHETYPENLHPLLKSFKNGKIQAIENPKEAYLFKQVEGEGVYQVPVGPVHAGIIEPGHFRFSVIGEPIFNLEIRLFYKHRGIEKLAEGKTPLECVSLAEAVSGDESAANATGFCMAVEQICEIKVPERAEYLRAIVLELERIYSLLGDLAGMAVDIGFALVASPFFIMREEVLRQNEKLTGSRFLRGIIVPGGLKKDLSDKSLEGLPVFLKKFSHMFEQAFERAMASSSLIDRFAMTGEIKRELISPLNLTGPLAKASGSPEDIRLDKPYGAYKIFAPKSSVRNKGDVLSRFEVKADEIGASVDLILKFLEKMPDGPICAKFDYDSGTQTRGYSLALVEAPRGQNLHWVYLKDGVIDRYKVRTASFCNWQAIEHAVIGNIVPDFPLINKSLNLSYAGTDL
jgi:Ni,Fe-hydrogenase III large subunit/Ni,Fe-hydrogenase III component G